MNYKRSVLVIIMAFLLTVTGFSLTGCGGGGGSTESSGPVTVQNGVLSQNKLEYKVINEDIEVSNPASYTLYSRIMISGLTDEKVQDAINDTLEAKFTEVATSEELPPYRGITSAVTKGGAKTSDAVSMNVTGNFNNILSVLLTRIICQGGIVYSDFTTLNFDLTTGELITLNDLFKDENVPGETISSAVASKLDVTKNQYTGGNMYDADRDYYMLTSFTKLNDDQKFYLTDDGIVVVLDYNNPEMYPAHYQPIELLIGYSEVDSVLSLDRYVTGSTIFDDSEEKNILVHVGTETAAVDNAVPEGTDNLKLSLSCSYPAELSGDALAKAKAESAMNEDLLSELRSKAAANAPDINYSYYRTVAGNRVANYYNLMVTDAYTEGGFRVTDIDGYVYDLKGNQIQLGDLFTSGLNYEGIIKKAIKDQLSLDFGENAESYGGQTIDDIYNGITFTLDTYGLQIKTQPIKFESDAGTTGFETSVSVFISYDEFGCGHMTIFN